MLRFSVKPLLGLAFLAAAALAACSKTAEPTPPPADVAAPAPSAEAPPAPASAPAQEHVHTFKIGEFSALALWDGGMELPNDNKVFDLGGAPAEVAEVLSAAGLPTDKLALTIHPMLVKTTDRVLLFDTGAGPLFGPGSGHMLASLAEAGIEPQSVTDIFISHSHGDHVGGLVNTEGKLNFPNARIHMSKPEWEFMSGQDQFKDWIPVIKEKLDAFKPGAELVPGVVKAVEIKGHTPGHSGFRITSGSDTLLYVGDSMHHFVISVQKPDWTLAFDGDSATATASRVALISQLETSGERIYAVHFPFPGIGKIEKHGDAAVWVAE